MVLFMFNFGQYKNPPHGEIRLYSSVILKGINRNKNGHR